MNFIHSSVKNQMGSVLIESALILPLAILLFAGTFESGRALLLNQKLMHAAYNVSDILARENIVTTDDVDDAYAAARLTLEPFRSLPADFDMNVAAVIFDSLPPNNPVEIWQENKYNNGVYDNAIATEADGLGEQNEGFLIVKLGYNYTPFIFTSLTNAYSTGPVFHAFKMQQTYIFKGRSSECISYDDTLSLIGDRPCP